MPKVVHLTTVHAALDVRIFQKEARTLAAQGYEVVVVAPHTHDEVVDGVQIRAVHQEGRRLRRMLLTAWRVYRIAARERADVYHFHDPELAGIGVLLSLRARVVWDLHENYPEEVARRRVVPRPLRRLVTFCLRAVQRIASPRIAAYVTVNSQIARQLPARKTVVVTNYAMADEWANVSAADDAHDGAWPLVYAGAITPIRGLREVFAALELLDGPEGKLLALAGKVSPPSLAEELESAPGAARAEFLGVLGRPELGALLAWGRAGIVTFLPHPNHVEASPNKLFEYMAAGLAVIASDFSAWREIVAANRCGLMVDPEDRRALADAMQWVLDHPDEAREMGRRGREAVLTTYNWESEGRKLVALYERLVGPGGAGAKTAGGGRRGKEARAR
jgi:glycosyltransferase involved in cell wall biosynthesis